MRKVAWLKMAVAVFVLLATVSAIAAENTASISVGIPVQLNGKQIAQGNYKVSWTGSNDQVQVKIMAGRKEVASGTAKIVELKDPSARNTLVYRDGNLREIDLAGKKTALVFAE